MFVNINFVYVKPNKFLQLNYKKYQAFNKIRPSYMYVGLKPKHQFIYEIYSKGFTECISLNKWMMNIKS